MNKKYIFSIIVIIMILIGAGVYLYNLIRKPASNEQNYSGYRVAANNTIVNTNSSNTTNTDVSNSENTNNSTIEAEEREIASYTSKIKTKDEGRQTNISLTCDTLNGTIVKNGDTFSFCDTVGKATASKGYEEANVFQNGEEVEALGGGKCQVSSTLYNAVLKVSELEVIERHPHSGDVYYVPEGKDAAVAYGSYDFKFKNNTGNSIKIIAENTEDNVTIKILKIR
jgi:vancomycin resistance protein YoaR